MFEKGGTWFTADGCEKDSRQSLKKKLGPIQEGRGVPAKRNSGTISRGAPDRRKAEFPGQCRKKGDWTSRKGEKIPARPTRHGGRSKDSGKGEEKIPARSEKLN